MLSYMLPVEDKPPPIPNKNLLQLELELKNSQQRSPRHNMTPGLPPIVTTTTSASILTCETLTNGNSKKMAKSAPSKTSTISSESSVSSISSDVASSATSQNTVTPTDRPKPKIIINGTKHAPLKRVSFGSSKGSMVETLIYESPLQEEPETSPILEAPCPFPADGENTESEPSKRVRVTFFESEKPLVLSSPEADFLLDTLDAPSIITNMTTPSPVSIEHAPPYNRQASTDSGWDNPFRPDGDLSREADEIVELIKGGKPITPTPGSVAPKLPFMGEDEDHVDNHSGCSSPIATPASTATLLSAAPPPPLQNNGNKAPAGANGNAACGKEKPGAVDVQRGTVILPSDASQVEHVVLKKKPKCKCCVIQ